MESQSHPASHRAKTNLAPVPSSEALSYTVFPAWIKRVERRENALRMTFIQHLCIHSFTHSFMHPPMLIKCLLHARYCP